MNDGYATNEDLTIAILYQLATDKHLVDGEGAAPYETLKSA